MAQPLTPSGLTLEEALKLQAGGQQNIPKEGQVFISSSDARTGDIAQLFRVQGGQVQSFDPRDILTEQERMTTGNVGAQRGLAIERLKARGIDVSALPQVQFPSELGLPVVGGSLANLFQGATATTTAPQTGTTASPSTSQTGLVTGTPGTLDFQRQLEAQAKALGVNLTPVSDVSGFKSPQVSAPTTTAPTITSPTSLALNTEISTLQKKIQDQSAKIAVGLASGGRTEILAGLFEKFGVGEATTALNDFNAQVLKQQQLLRDIPEDIKNTLQDVGVTQSQLNRLILKETQKPLETLRDLMELKGVAQDRINQSLRFVGLFSDAAMADQAARIEAMKFDFETNKDLLSRLDTEQQNFIKSTLNEKKGIMSVMSDAINAGLSAEAISNIQNSTTQFEALQKFSELKPAPKFTEKIVGGFRILQDEKGKVISTSSSIQESPTDTPADTLISFANLIVKKVKSIFKSKETEFMNALPFLEANRKKFGWTDNDVETLKNLLRQKLGITE